MHDVRGAHSRVARLAAICGEAAYRHANLQSIARSSSLLRGTAWQRIATQCPSRVGSTNVWTRASNAVSKRSSKRGARLTYLAIYSRNHLEQRRLVAVPRAVITGGLPSRPSGGQALPKAGTSQARSARRGLRPLPCVAS